MNILINETKKITFVMVDSAGVEVTGLGTGFALQVSKNAGAFGASAGTKAEIGSGWYSYVFTATETNTLGPLAVKVTGAGAVQQNILYEVVGSDWTAVPTYASTAELKTYLGITGATDDDLLTSFLARAQTVIEINTRRIWECSTDSTRYFTVGVDTDSTDLWFDEDLCQVTTVVTDADSVSPITLTKDTDFITQPRNSTPWYGFRILGSTGKYWTYTTDPEMGVSVTGRWAYSITPPQDIIQATLNLSGYLYRAKDAQTFDVTVMVDGGMMTIPKGTPQTVVDILVRRRKPGL